MNIMLMILQNVPEATEKAAETLSRTEWGALVIILIILLVGMFWVGRKDKMKIHEAHAAERKEWRETIEKQFETSNEKTEKFTSVVTELNTLIKQDIASKRP